MGISKGAPNATHETNAELPVDSLSHLPGAPPQHISIRDGNQPIELSKETFQ